MYLEESWEVDMEASSEMLIQGQAPTNRIVDSIKEGLRLERKQEEEQEQQVRLLGQVNIIQMQVLTREEQSLANLEEMDEILFPTLLDQVSTQLWTILEKKV